MGSHIWGTHLPDSCWYGQLSPSPHVWYYKPFCGGSTGCLESGCCLQVYHYLGHPCQSCLLWRMIYRGQLVWVPAGKQFSGTGSFLEHFDLQAKPLLGFLNSWNVCIWWAVFQSIDGGGKFSLVAHVCKMLWGGGFERWHVVLIHKWCCKWCQNKVSSQQRASLIMATSQGK